MPKIDFFIINLKKDIKKLEHMKNVCKRNHIDPIFIEAVYGKNLDDDIISRVYIKDLAMKYFGRELTKGEIGTALSHLQVYKLMLENTIQAAVILEDDVDFKISYQDILKLIKELPKDWECVLLGHHARWSRDIDTTASVWNRNKVLENYQCVRFTEFPVGAYGYIINKKGALKRIKDFKKIDRPIDHWNDEKLNLYGIQPSIIKINEYFLNYSSLTSERSKMEEQTNRTSFETFKDKVRSTLTRLQLLEAFFIVKSFFMQFKILKKYSSH